MGFDTYLASFMMQYFDSSVLLAYGTEHGMTSVM